MIFGLEPRDPWPEGWTPLEAVTVVKALTHDGGVALVLSSTPGLMAWEAAGMLRAGAREQEQALSEGFQDHEEENDA